MINPNRFRLIAIRSITPYNLDTEDYKAALAMQKKTAGFGDWLYFHSGYKLVDIKVGVNDNPQTTKYGTRLFVKEDAYMDECLYNVDGFDTDFENNICINIGAIVGSNGSGKSSTIDMLIRIINNFAAAYLGEGVRNAASDHLYFIENVYGGLVVELGGMYLLILVEGRSVKIGTYKLEDDGGYSCYSPFDLLSFSGKTDKSKIIEAQGHGIIDLSEFFYTTIYNYSMYAFNYLDYYQERTKEDRWGRKKQRRDEAIVNHIVLPSDDYQQEDVWLNGLFHKNDGYQVPIVLNPLREEGVLDIPNENKLAKERLLSMLFYTSTKEHSINVEHKMPSFPFRIINEDKVLVKLRFKQYEKPAFATETVLKHLGLTKRSHLVNRFDTVRWEIIDIWKRVYQIHDREETPASNLAWEYVVYKTLKISKNYNLQYGKILENLSRADYKSNRLEKHLDEIMDDDSHITLKLRRALNYIKFNLYGDDLNSCHDINDIYRKILDIQTDPSNVVYRVRNEHLYAIRPEEEELAPPPIFEINYQLIEKKYIDDNLKYPEDKLFSMEGLSSGERQVAYSISNLVYHIVNIESVWECGQEDINSNLLPDELQEKVEKRIYYKYINVIFDEVELYFHPDLQRRYVASLVSALRDIRLRHIKGISILMVTHSPFVLSDIPQSNILFLGDRRDTQKETYAANIHDILNNRFFMDYSIGEQARFTLNALFKIYSDSSTGIDVSRDWLKKESKFAYLKTIVGDKYLRREIEKIYSYLSDKYGSKTELIRRRDNLQRQLDEVKALLSND